MSGPYAEYSLPQLWAMVANERQADHTEHERAWARKQSMLKAQIGNLQQLRNNLTDAWHPERSEAARTFMGQITQTISVMSAACEAAGRVQDRFAAITEALADTRRQLEPLRAAYHDPNAALRSYLKNNTPLAYLLSGLPDDKLPSMGIPETISAALLDMHQERLDAEARRIMEATDQKVASAASSDILMPRLEKYENGAPPPAPAGGSDPSVVGGTYLPQPVFDPPPPVTRPVGGPIDSRTPDALDLGPFLTGAPRPVVSPAVLTAPPLPAVGGPAALPPAAVPLPPSTPGWIMQTPSGQRALRPGGVIESTPSPVRPVPSVGGVGRDQMRSAPRGAARVTANRPTAPNSAVEREEHTPAGGWRDRSYEAYVRQASRKRGAEDEQWPVAEGVAPIIEAPPPPGPHDAPPGVIGIDR